VAEAGVRSSSEATLEPSTLVTSDGRHLAADIRHVDRARAAVVVVHGFTAHRRHGSVVAIAEALARDGYAVLTYDARGHGESDGMCTLGNDEDLDVAAAVEAARALAGRVIVVGASMGAIAALRYAAHHDDIDGVVSVSCPARWQLRTFRTVVAAVLTQTRPGRRFLERRVGVRVAPTTVRLESPEALAPRVTCSLAIVHGLADRFMPSLEASRLHDQATSRRRLDLVPAMGHAFDDVGMATTLAAVAWCLEDPERTARLLHEEVPAGEAPADEECPPHQTVTAKPAT
jgi:pimeloyl-ACP methyl ester carboxylesterase